MLTIKDHGKYNILVITALYTYQQLYTQHSLNLMLLMRLKQNLRNNKENLSAAPVLIVS